MFRQERRQRQRVFAVPRHTQMQRFQPEIEQEGVERAETGAEVAQNLGAGFGRERRPAEFLPIGGVGVERIGLDQFRKFPVVPAVGTAVDHHPAERSCVPVDVFGGGMHDDVRAVPERFAEKRRGKRVVHHERDVEFAGQG
ncbi:hypothetical protein SDC9_164732 [bioreactor metagenome]|uniref:Uncharacterized protein n=1 Tax=bioreactor metagenome TaxID=1076179 RepID=A0A645FV25_9ZZZZ